MPHERTSAAAHLPLIVAALLAAASGVLHAAWVLFPLLDARFTTVMMGRPPDPQFRVGMLTVLAIAGVPILAIASALWTLHSTTQAAIGEGVAAATALYLALFDIGGGTSGWVPGALLLPIALFTYTLRDRRGASQP